MTVQAQSLLSRYSHTCSTIIYFQIHMHMFLVQSLIYLAFSLFCLYFLLQLLDCLGSLLDRPLIHVDFVNKYPVLLRMFEQELDQCKVIFDTQMSIEQDEGIPPINKNMPHVAGVLKWSNELRADWLYKFNALDINSYSFQLKYYYKHPKKSIF